MLFSGWYGYAIFSCSVITFFSYQVIPDGLYTIEQHSQRIDKSPYLAAVTSSALFRAFIRLCGINHILMSSIMLGTAKGFMEVEPVWQLILLAGEGSVALISAMCAATIWRVRWSLQRF